MDDSFKTFMGVMSDDKIKTEIEAYKDNPAVVELLQTELDRRVNERAQVVIMETFTKEVTKLFAKLPRPESIHNVYARWIDVEVKGIAELVRIGGEVTDIERETYNAQKDDTEREAYLVAGGMELRQPSVMVPQWKVETEHRCGVGSSASSGAPKTTARKLGVTVSKRAEAGSSQLELVGNFKSCEACVQHLGLDSGGDSANRFLGREGYFVEVYNGVDFTS